MIHSRITMILKLTDDNILDIHQRLQLSASLQEAGEAGEMKLIRKDLGGETENHHTTLKTFIPG